MIPYEYRRPTADEITDALEAGIVVTDRIQKLPVKPKQKPEWKPEPLPF